MTVTNTSEIELNGYKYKIKGGVKGAWQDPFPESIAIGDANYSNRRDLSSWIINDIRGIGAEEMDEAVDKYLCWWTNCITKYRNHILPPRLATALSFPTMPTIVDGGCELWTTATNLTNWTEVVIGTSAVTREDTIIHGGTYSARLTAEAQAASYAEIKQTAAGWIMIFAV